MPRTTWNRLVCANCLSDEDEDNFRLIKEEVWCRNCLTCPHGHWHHRTAANDLCNSCLLAAFSESWLWGRRIQRITEYATTAYNTYGIYAMNLDTYTAHEMDELYNRYGGDQQGWIAARPSAVPVVIQGKHGRISSATGRKR